MVTGAAPALDTQNCEQAKSDQTPDPKPATFKEWLVRKLSEIFEHNEKLDVTRF